MSEVTVLSATDLTDSELKYTFEQNEDIQRLRRWTRKEYMKMAELGVLAIGERTELIEGEIIQMSPQNSPHTTAAILVAEALRTAFGQGYVIRIQAPMALSEISEPEPDVAVVAGTPRDYRDAHPTTALLIVEISDTTLTYDRSQKASLYAKAGIEDYWIINLVHQRLEVYRNPLLMPEQPSGYGYKHLALYMTTDSVAPLAAPQGFVKVVDILP
ncbi:TPA: Uma2 family endonuclease [Candidatus Poribacteria bacterium]|nr:Uma2 family endonuclease [Candidatus Poribacteria bacterium]